MRKVKLLHPSYYTKFACSGNACEDHCCKNWSINIDKNTYMLYRKIGDPEFVQVFKDRVKRIKGTETTTGAYASFVLDDKNVCPFLDGDGLCEIQKKHGHDYLCITCQVYPRIVSRLQKGMIEASMTTSCPELARLAILNPKPITFELSELELDEKNVLFKCGASEIDKNGAGGELIPYAWQIREACIDILQCRNMPFPDRFLAVGMMLNKLKELEKSGEADKAPETAASYARMAKGGEFIGILDAFPENQSLNAIMQAILMKYALDVCNKPGFKYVPFRGFADTVRKWMQANNVEKTDFVQLYGMVNETVVKHWPDFLSKYDYVLENYFVNLVFAKLFPFGIKELTPYQHFIALAEQYALMRMLLCTNGENEGGISEKLILQVVSSMSVDVIHGQNAKRIVQGYEKTGNDTLAHISFLLR